VSFIRVRDLAGGKVQFHTVASDDVHVRDGAGEILTGDQTGLILFETREDAGKYVRAYWEDFVEHEGADEVGEMFGVETLVSWALGRLAGPGSIMVNNLNEWLDLHLDCPEEHFEQELEVDAVSENLVEALGFVPTVVFCR